MSEMFMRKAEVIIGGSSKWTYPSLMMQFTAKFDSTPIPAETEISIYNLSDSSISEISRGQSIILNAGYKDDIGTILDGVITSRNVEQSNVDKVLKIKALNVTGEYLDKAIAYTYEGGATSESLIKSIFEYIGVTPNVVSLTNNITYELGFNAYGKVGDVLKRIANEANSKLIIRNSSISIVPANNGNDIGFLLNASTGLISIEAIDKSTSVAKYKLKCLLNHAINSYTILEIQSKTFNGIAIVTEGQHKSTGNDFITECEILPI